MVQYYDRYKAEVFDFTTCNTCAALLHWMEKRAEFDQVRFQPGSKRGNLKEKWGEEKVRELIDATYSTDTSLFMVKNIKEA